MSKPKQTGTEVQKCWETNINPLLALEDVVPPVTGVPRPSREALPLAQTPVWLLAVYDQQSPKSKANVHEAYMTCLRG